MNDKEFYDSLRIKYSDVLNAPEDEIKNVYQSTNGTDPKQTANVMNVANKINAHPIAIQNDLKGATEAANTPADEYWEHLRKNRPITYNYLSDPVNMATTKDIIQEQDNREGEFQRITHGFKLGDLQVKQSKGAWNQILSVLSGKPVTGEEYLTKIESEMDELSKNPPKGISLYYFANQVPNILFGIGKAAQRGLEAAGIGAATAAVLSAPTVLGEAAAVPAGAVTGAGVGSAVGYAESTMILEAGSAYRDFIKLKDKNGKQIDIKTAAEYAIAVGAINSGIEMLTIGNFLKVIPGGNKIMQLLGTKKIKDLVAKRTAGKAFKTAVTDLIKAGASETLQEIAQETTNVAMETAITGKVDKGAGKRITDVVVPTLQSTLVNPLTILGLGTNTIENLHQVSRAKENAKLYEQVGQNANNSELLKRYPDGFKTLVEQQIAGTPIENVYIDAEQFVTLMQEQNPDILNAAELVADKLGFGDQLQTALETGDKIKVSLADWTTNVAPTEFYNKIQPHVSFAEDGLTLFQAEQEEKRIGEEIKAEQQKAAELMAQDEEKQASYNTIYEDVKGKLLEAGRPENIKEKSWNSYVDKSAKLWASHAIAEASRRQISVAEWYQGANVLKGVTKGQLQEGTLQQAAIETPEFKNWFGDSKVVDMQGKPLVVYHGTPSENITSFDVAMSGKNTGAKDTRGAIFFTSKKTIAESYQSMEEELTPEGKKILAEIERLGEKYKNLSLRERINLRNDKDYNLYSLLMKDWMNDELLLKPKYKKQIPSGKTYSVYLKLQEPLIINAQGQAYDENQMSEWIRKARQEQKDGLIIKNIVDPGDDRQLARSTVYVVFNPSQIKSIENQGTFDPNNPNIYQQDQTQPRGFVKITPEGSLVGLLGSSDASTFLHESAHIFLNDTFEFVKTGQADEQYLKDWTILKEWMNVADDQEALTIEQQEQFARGFEAYLYEGKSPSEGLKKAFAAFRRWLTRIYRDVKGLDVELSDPVRQVMDRMLATDEEIAEAEALSGYNDDIVTEADVTPETWAKLQDIKLKAHETAISKLLKRQMDELKEENKQFLENERETFRGLVEEEISKEPIYQTFEEVRSKFGGKNIKDTANKYIDGTLTDKGRFKLDTIAETNGYSSGSELAQTIIDTPYFNEVVDQRLKEHMDQYSDLMNTARIKEAAMEAIRNEKQLELDALERELIMDFVQKTEAGQARRQSALERSRIAVSAAKNHAKEILSRKNYKESTAFKSYFKAERDAAVKAATALKSGNDAAAARFAEQRMLNHALATEAIKNQKDVQKYLDYFKKFQRKHGNLLKMPAEFMTQIEVIMERFKLIEPVQREKTPESLVDFLKTMKEEYHDIPVSDFILSGESKPLNEMTLGELKDVYDAVKMISHSGNKYNFLSYLFERAEINAVGKEIAQSIENNVGHKREDTSHVKQPKNAIQKAGDLADEVNSWLVKPEFLARFLDGNKDGIFQKYFIDPRNQAWSEEAAMEQKVVSEFGEIISQFYDQKELPKRMKEIIFVPEAGESMSKEQIIMAVLNMGNETNKQRIRDGHNYTDETLQAIVDLLDEKECQMVQAIWDYNDTFWPAIVKLEEEVTGIAPEKIEPTPVQTRYGTLRGGYIHIAYDAEKSIRMKKYEEQTNALYKEAPGARAATRHNHTHKRTKEVNQKLNLSFSVVTNHYVNVVHDLTHRKLIIDQRKLLNQPDIQKAILNAVGIKGYEILDNSLKAIASDQGEHLDAVDKAFRWLRSRTTLGAMGLNLRVALLQTSGYFQSAWEIGAIPTIKGITEFALNPVENWNFIKEKSTFMKDRSQLVDRDIYDFSRRMFKGDNKLQRYAYSLIGIMDQSVSAPTWLGAYKEELQKSGDEEAAIRAGDGAVRRSQGSGAVKDLSAAQRGTEIKKALTMFYSYGNLLYNRFWLATSTAGVQLSKGQTGNAIKNIAAMTFYGWILPGTFEFVLREALRSHEDDDPEKFTKRLIASMASGLLQTIPLVRDVGAYLLNKTLGVYSSFRITPLESSIESIGEVAAKGRKLMEGDGDWIDFGEAAAKTGAFSSGIPQQSVNWTFNFIDWIENNGEADWRDLFSRRRD